MLRDRARDHDKYLHVWLGHHQKLSQARVFKNFTVEAFDTPSDARFYLGADWGYSNDPTVLIRCFLVGSRLFIDREVYQVGLEIDNTPAAFDLLDPSNPKMARRWPMIAEQRQARDHLLYEAKWLSPHPAQHQGGRLCGGWHRVSQEL